MADEGGMQNFHKEDDDGAITAKSIFFKGAEILLSLIIIGLIVYPLDSFYTAFKNPPQMTVFDLAFIYVTLVGYVLINAVFILGYFLGDRIPKVTVLLFTVLAILLHVITASLMVVNWRKFNGSLAIIYNNHTYGSKLYLDMFIAATILTYLNAILYAVDVFFTIKYF